MTMTVTQTKGTVTTQHVIDFSGLSGLIIWVLLGSLFLFVIAYATTSWVVIGTTKNGIWESCAVSTGCISIAGNGDWLTATQAMLTIGLICLIAAVVIGMVYMFLHKINKDIILLLLLATSGAAAVFILIGVIIYGAKIQQNLNYSFAFAVISSLMTLGATVLAFIHMRNTKK